MAEMKEVFISYHEKSAGEYVTKLANRLEGAGISCWYAKRDLPPGGDFADYIPPQIYGCKVFLLILNEGANQSRHVESEVGLAFRRYNKGEKIDILPYQVEKCDFAHWLDYYLIHIQIQSAEAVDMGALATEVAHKLGREPVKNGWCGPGVEWTFRDGVLTISKDDFFGNVVSGKMGDFYIQNVPDGYNTPWWNERENIISVVMKDGVTNIGSAAFSECVNLTEVAIPESVASIESIAFHGCSALIGVNIPHGVASIGGYAFYGCSALTSVNIPDSVADIGNGAFERCRALTVVNIPDSVASIGAGAFRGCSALNSVSIPDSVADIQSQAFRDCSGLKSVSVPANAKIADDAFDPTTEVIRRPQLVEGP